MFLGFMSIRRCLTRIVSSVKKITYLRSSVRLFSVKSKVDMSKPIGKHLYDDSGDTPADMVQMSIGAPGGEHLKSAARVVSDAVAQLMESEDAVDGVLMQYGPQLGAPFYREELAKFLSTGYGDPVKADNVMLTAGATHGLHFVATSLMGQNALVFIEDPSYFLAINMLRDELGMKIVPVSTDKQGVNVNDLEKKIVEHKKLSTYEMTEKHPFWAMMYLIPTFNNPQSSCLTPDRSKRVIELARKHDVLVFCDDVYNMMKYTPGPAPPRLLSYDNPSDANYSGHVLSNGTFAKLLSPALRVGWIEAGERLIKLFHGSPIAISGGAMNHWTSQVVATSLKTGTMQKHLQHVLKDLQERKDAVCELLAEKLPSDSSVFNAQGGYFLWITLPEHMDSWKIAEEALRVHKVKVVPGPKCSPSNSFKNCIRISYSHYKKDILLEATNTLCQVINKYV